MAYNPFDDVIDQDPAYMQEGGGTRAGLVQPVTTDQGPRYISSGIAKAYSLLTPEEETLQENERNKQLRELATAQALQGTKFEEYAGQADLPSFVVQSPGIKERLDQAGYQPQSFKEALSRFGQFFYGDQRKAFEKLSQGQELTQEDRNAIALSPLDTLDFIFPPVALKKLAGLGLKTVDDVLRASDDIPEITEVKNYFGGAGFVPEGVVRQAEKGEGLVSSQTPPGKGVGTGQRYAETGLPKDVYFKSYIKPEQAKDIEKLADILNKTSIEDMNKPLKQIMVDNNLNSLLRVESKAREKEKIIPAQFVKQTLKRYEMVPEEKLNKLSEITKTQPTKINVEDREQIKNFFEDLILKDEKISRHDIAEKLNMSQAKFQTLIQRTPELKALYKSVPLEETRRSGDVKLGAFSLEKYLKDAKDEFGFTNINSRGNQNDRNEYLLFDGLLRSLDAKDVGLKPGASRRAKTEKFLEYVKENIPNWKQVYNEELNNLAYVDQQRNLANKTITQMFNDYAEKFPKQFENENLTEYLLQVSHNYPLREDFRVFKGGGADIDSVRLAFSRTNNVHHAKIEKEVTKLKNKIEQQGKATEQQMKELKKLDQQAKELGTLVYTKIGDEYIAIGTESAPGVNTLVNALEKHFNNISKRKGKGRIVKGEIIPVKFKEKQIKVKGKYGDVLEPRPFQKGGPVKMALGGDPLINMNQQQFMSDPAFEGEDYFNQAVESGNLYAFNPGKIFKLFSKTDAVYTPKKLPDPVAEQQAAPPGTTLPTTQVVQPEDFAFQSFTLNKILDPQAPKAGTPDAWRQFLYGGGQGGKVPEAEMFDTGLEQFLDDYAKYYPDRKIDRQTLVDYYEMSPIGNIEIKVKDARGTQPSVHSPSDDPAYKGYVGGSRHRNTGSQPLDEVGTDYREVVVKAGGLPGDKKPFVSSGHFEEENVLGFTRVADYMQPDGRKVSVIQELQTDMLTKVRKEQERLQALLKRIENIKARAARDLQSGDPYREASATNALEQLNQAVPPTVEETLKKHQDLIKPFPNEAAKSTIPDYQKQLSNLQLQIEDVLQKDIQQSRPETGFEIQAIAKEQQKILDSLLDLNRSGQLDDMLKSVKVPSTRDTEELMRYGEDTNVRGIGDGTSYYSTKELELFPPIPFNKQADYVDLLIKSTIKDAQGRGINKVAIYPPELVNQRWGKRPDSDAGKKFRDLYGKVAIQQMKNIAKKYGGDAKVEIVLNPDASDRGLTYFKRNIDGEFEFMKQDQLAQGLDPEEAQLFIDEQLNRNAHGLGSNQVIYAKEVAPGQTMDYYVQPYTTDASEKKFELIPLGPGDDRNAAQVIVEEYNPQEIQMFTITLDSDKAKAPMFMFKKKSGGSIDKDSLVSITDIYGEYGR